jgi:GntR family transcriptional regulator
MNAETPRRREEIRRREWLDFEIDSSPLFLGVSVSRRSVLLKIFCLNFRQIGVIQLQTPAGTLLDIRIEPSSGMPVTRQIVDQIRAACASGALKPGDQLPSMRELARQLFVNQNTILRVYEKLAADGLIERHQGTGTFVSADPPGGQLRTQRAALSDELRRIASRAKALGIDQAELHGLLDQALRHNVAPRRQKEEKPA